MKIETKIQQYRNKKKLSPHNFKKIVVELPFGLGDKIMCFPLFKSLKNALPDCQITVLSPNKTSTILLKNYPFIDEVIEYDLPNFSILKIILFFLKGGWFSLYKKFKKKQFDLFISVHPNLFRTILLKTLPFEKGIQNQENTHKSLEVKNILDFLNIPFIPDYTLSIQNTGCLEKYNLYPKKYIVIDRYAQHLEKDPRQWFYFDKLIEMLKKTEYIIVLCGKNPHHQKREDVMDLINQTNFLEILEIIKNAFAVIAMDTGFFHFAYALKTPVLGIFGPVSPQDRIPLDSNLLVKTISLNLPCTPCIKNKVDIQCRNKQYPYQCLKQITPEMVLEIFQHLVF